MATFLPSPEVSSFSGGRRPLVRTVCDVSPRNVQKISMSSCGSSRGARVRVCSSVKDLEDSPTALNDLGVYANTVSSTKLNMEEEQKRNYYLNMGYAIRTIREEFPAIFYKEPSFDIYRNDIVFKDPLNTFTGIENYKSIFWALRFHGRMFFTALWIDIVSVWQPVENIIMVRWTVHGIPRVPWESRGRFDATSEYKFDKDGKIFEHRVHNIALNAPPKFRVLAVQEFIEYIGCPSTPKPTFFEISFFSSPNITPVTKFATLRHQLGTILASVKINEEEHSQQT